MGAIPHQALTAREPWGYPARENGCEWDRVHDIISERTTGELPMKPKTIVIVEDRKAQRLALQEALKMRGFHVEREECTQDQLIRHIRALALRRALSVERPDATEEIQRLAESSRDRSEAIIRFCKDVLAENFSACLGAPFIILFTENNRTRCCAG